jgi:IMP dehydrogenase
MMRIREGLTFDDVLMVPQYSEVPSRSDVDLTVKWGNLKFKHPIIPANMKTITGFEMAFEVCKSGGLAILHRFMPIEDQLAISKSIIDSFGNQNFAVSIGVKEEDWKNFPRFMEEDVLIYCIDIAHGDSKQCIQMIKDIKSTFSQAVVIAGNVATKNGARRLWDAGADVVKVGVGPGSLCTTRIETGCGVPQLTALMDVAEAQAELVALEKTRTYPNEKRKTYPFIADGGIKKSGDIVKALAFADMVMVGNVFAGAEETPGEVVQMGGKTFKHYVGSSTHKTNHVEGVAAMVATKGKFADILTKLIEGVRSGCSYNGAINLAELRDNPEFIRITNAGLVESHPHDVILR